MLSTGQLYGPAGAGVIPVVVGLLGLLGFPHARTILAPTGRRVKASSVTPGRTRRCLRRTLVVKLAGFGYNRPERAEVEHRCRLEEINDNRPGIGLGGVGFFSLFFDEGPFRFDAHATR